MWLGLNAQPHSKKLIEQFEKLGKKNEPYHEIYG
jgi:hypothetical protein